MELNHVTAEAPAMVRLAKTLKHLIAEGSHVQHAPLPSYRQLAKRHGVGVRVVRDAIDILEREGVVRRIARRGVFVQRGGTSTIGENSPRTLKCVNIVERLHGTMPSFLRTAYLRGYTVALEDCDVKMRFVRRPSDVKDCTSIFSDRYPLKSQGCILLNVIDPWLLEWLSDRKVPFVVQNYIAYDMSVLPSHHSIVVNKVGAGRTATQHLLDLGHRRMGFLGRTPVPNHAELMAYEGFVSAMRCAALSWSADDLLCLSTEDEGAALAPVRSYLSRCDRPTAVIAENEAIARAVLQAAGELQLRVPEDLSVVGFRNLVDESGASARMTAVTVPSHAHGHATMEVLLAASEGRLASFERRVLECALVVGNTTGPYRA